MSDPIDAHHDEMAIRADLTDANASARVRGSYRLGDYRAEMLDDDPTPRGGRGDELEDICPHPRHTEDRLPPIQPDFVIACPHGHADDRNCRRCMEAAYGPSDEMQAARQARRKRRAS